MMGVCFGSASVTSVNRRSGFVMGTGLHAADTETVSFGRMKPPGRQVSPVSIGATAHDGDGTAWRV